MSEPPIDTWTNAEIVRSLRRIETNVHQLDEKIDSLDATFVRAELFESMMKSQHIVFENHERRLNQLEGWGLWVTRLVMGALIIGVLGLLIHQQGSF